MRLVVVIVIAPAFGGLGDDFFSGFARHLLIVTEFLGVNPAPARQ
jgi:hypothetical protein